MLKVLSFILKGTLTLSVISFFSGSDVSILLILGQVLAILTLDNVFRSDDSGVLVVENLRQYVKGKEYSERMVSTAVYMFAAAAGAVMFYVVPSFSADTIVIPDIRNMKAFTVETNYMSLEGYVISYCRQHGREVSRGEARKLVKEAMKAGSASVITAKKMMARENIELIDAETIAAMKKAEVKAKIAPAAVRSSKLGEVKYSGLLDDYRHKSISTVSPAPGRLITKSRVAVLPFNNLTQNDEAVRRVKDGIEKEFKSKGYAVVPKEQIRNIVGDVSKLTEGDLEKLAEVLEADMIVTGDIQQFERQKKFRLAGFVLGGIVNGWHNHADVQISTKVFKTAESSFTYNKQVDTHKKDQTLGLFYSSRGVMNESLKNAVTELYNKF